MQFAKRMLAGAAVALYISGLSYAICSPSRGETAVYSRRLNGMEATVIRNDIAFFFDQYRFEIRDGDKTVIKWPYNYSFNLSRRLADETLESRELLKKRMFMPKP